MKLIIDIPEHIYEMVINTGTFGCYRFDTRKAIKKGTPLPEGHGRLIDADAMFKDICNSIESMTNIGIAVDGEYLWGKLNDALFNAPTIIEADKAESEDRE